MKPSEFAPPNPRFQTHVTDSYRGQTNFVTTMIIDGREVGSVEYSVYQDQPQIDMIYIEPESRRKGYGTLLVKELQQLYPGQEIKFGMLTPSGEKLYRSLDFQKTVDQSIEAKNQKLIRIRAELAKLAHKLERLQKQDPALASKWIKTVGDRWNQLHDLEYRYEQQVRDAGSSVKKMIREQ